MAESAENSPKGTPGIVIIYTDGACIGNPGPGGWAAILIWGEHRRELSGAVRNTTNNRMELLAAITALETLKRPCRVDLYTDSQYLKDGITKWVQNWMRRGWRTASKEPVKNVDLWTRLVAAVERHSVEGAGIEWKWTRGHAGDELNERADSLADSAARGATRDDPEDVPEGERTTIPQRS